MPTRARGVVSPSLRLPAALLGLFGTVSTLLASELGPTVRFRRLRPDDGLSQSVVLALAEDPRGFLWVGTQDGLDRYDGYEFVVLRHDRNDPETLQGSHVRALATAADGSLLVGTTAGVDRIDPGGHVRRLARLPEVTALVEHRGTVWAGSASGLFRWNGDRFEPVADGEVTRLLSDGDRLWVGLRDTGLLAVDPSGRHRRWSADPDGLPDDTIWSLAATGHHLWVGTAAGLVGLDLERGSWTAPVEGLSSDLVLALLPDGPDLWVATDSGLDLVSGTGVVRSFRHDSDDTTSLSGDYVTELLRDHAGNVWIGTWGDGLSLFSRHLNKFPLYTARPGSPHHLTEDSVYALLEEPDGTLWIGTASGLERLDPSTGRFQRILPTSAHPSGLPSEWIYALARDPSGSLWIGTYDGGLARLRDQSDRFDLFRHDTDRPTSISNDIVNTILPRPTGELWLGTAAGLDLFAPTTGTARHYRHDPYDPTSLPHEGVLTLGEDAAGRLWVGTDGGGLARLDAPDGPFHRVSVPADLSIVLSVHPDHDGSIWVGTDGGGLVHLGGDGRLLEELTHRNGLPNDVVYGVLPGSDATLWLSTNAGLVHVDRIGGPVRVYGVVDGLQSHEFNQGASHRGPGGELFFGGIQGFNRFFPERIEDNPEPPPVVLSSVEVDGSPRALDGTALELGPGDHAVTFELAALDLTAPERNLYAWRLAGFDAGWIEAGSRRHANYTNLDPGRYALWLRASNADGVWSEGQLLSSIVVHPPYWGTWWFRLGAVALGIVALVGGVRLRLRALATRGRELEALVAARTRELEAALADLQAAHEAKNTFLGIATHELRQPLALVLGYVDLALQHLRPDRQAARTVTFLERARRASATMEALISSLLDIAAIESGRLELDLGSTDIPSILAEQVEIHRPRAQAKEISLALDQSPVPAVRGDRLRLEEVVDNLLSNAIKFTPPGGAVRVRCQSDGSAVRVVVEDNGPGLSAEDQKVLFTAFATSSPRPTGGETSTGLGLAIVQKIVSRHGGEVWVDSEPGRGSAFGFQLPAEGTDAPAGPSP